jgi:hypothetical protein
VLDSSGEATYFYGPATYRLALHDAADVPLWVIDPVTGTGGGSAGASAGVGWGQNTVELRPANGAAQAAASVFPPDVLAIGLTLWISETFGVSRGLQQVGIGTALQPDQWGVLPTLTAATDTTAGAFQAYSGQPQPTPGLVTLTAYGGLFDGAGAVYLTGHFLTLTPSQQLGSSYVPPAGGVVQPLPPATVDSPGLVELATVPEHLDGLRGDVVCTPEGLQARWDTLPVISPASELTVGITRYGTDAETVTGTLRTVATHPAGVKTAINDAISASGATTTTGLWRFETAVSGAPASGDVALNQTDYALATEVRIHKTSSGGTDTSAVLAGLLPGDGIYIQDRNDSTRRARYSVTAAGVDQGTWVSFAVSNVAVGTVALGNNQEVTVTFTIATSLPPATETQAGITRYATAAETTAGSVATAAVTPAGLAARVPAGTALSVARYAAGGTTLEASPTVVIDASGRLGVGTAAPTSGLHLQGETNPAYIATITAYTATANAPILAMQHAGGTPGSPAVVASGARSLNVSGSVWARDAGDTTHTFVGAAQVLSGVESVDAQGRIGAHLAFYTAPGGSAAITEKLRLTQAGNLHVGASAGTNASRVLALGSGTDPTAAHPADAVQLWVRDRAAIAGKGSLLLRAEDGTPHLLGDLTGHGTLLEATLGSGASYQALNVKGSTLYVGQSSVQERAVAGVTASFVSSTDATRTGRLTVSAYDATAAREGLRVEADGSAARIGFLGALAVARQTVPAAASDATTTQALANSLRTALVNLGLCV